MSHLNRLFTQTDVADLLGISPSCFHHRMKLGKYPRPSHVREGRKAARYTVETVEDILRCEEYRSQRPRVKHCPYDYVMWQMGQTAL